MTPEELGARVRQLARGQCRLRRLLDAVVAISADMEPRAVLEHIVAAAADLVGARYGALDGLGPEGDFVDLVTVGVDEERMLAAEGLPQGHGLLIRLTTDRKPLRVDDIRADPRAVGFPPCHPRMTVRDTVYGNVYLADKTDGTPFTDDNEAILTALASAASLSVEKARLHQDLKRVAMHLQLRMLPDLSPLRCELRYEPASELPRLGGDWCDAVLLPDGGISVVIGDVTLLDLSVPDHRAR
ncbi:hypothetical protein GTY20_19335 [Streptomyces sp. SID4946]|uniref:GAF domain-containing protein n=1 Tax=Streptomyces sp. LamerLS-31b TaxID=1839765 RepID=UPI00081EA9C9|nr:MULTISPECIES: GAF domain-containing protein [unclassified Streptomyces]MYQ93312.1 hypothetical protein [Streptomyces sp. SID4946]SCF80974.1 GAF domain-containing protein [Streptomyces sp. DconLS]SCF82501.1 GAF domain-containing protein [Streptomyces sp. LamerLS-31b]